ncbi:hypothetical protein SAMN05428964_10897 [Thalassospira xiamenensis]|uniref:Uncharacterized protein n=1 Tax=Thalassospira xiamenensis TaxID=220697 RepID=A0A285TX35_9PROT|nr:hypothetical protein SAMN05428964_10897 [Thalassospira xiamenensis]
MGDVVASEGLIWRKGMELWDGLELLDADVRSPSSFWWMVFDKETNS